MPKSFLNWKNLKLNKCPQCGRSLDNFVGGKFECQCTSRITEEKFNSIVMDMNHQALESERDQRANEYLEGFGRE